MATLIQYPGSNGAGNPIDGSVGHRYNPGDNQTWATLSAAAGSLANSDAITESMDIISDSGTDKWLGIFRGIYLFDTSSLGAGATISSAILSIYGQGKTDPLNITPDINIYSSAPASDTAIAAGDFDSLGTTAFSTAITYANISTSGYNDFTLNASGLAAISKTGNSKFGLRNANYDVSGTPPVWASSATSYFDSYGASQAGTTNDPKLVVIYTPGNINRSSFYFM